MTPDERQAPCGACLNGLPHTDRIGDHGQPLPDLPARPPLDTTNHHNALACPHCNPKGLKLAPMAERQALEALIVEWRGDMKPTTSQVERTKRQCATQLAEVIGRKDTSASTPYSNRLETKAST